MAPKLRTFSGPANLDQDDYLKAALEIYDFIEASKIETEHGVYYDINPGAGPDFEAGAVHGKYGLYSGSAGIAVFLIRLYEITGDNKYLDEAKKIFDEISGNQQGSDFYQDKIKNAANSTLPVIGWHTGVYTGPAGAGIVALLLYKLLQDRKYLIYAEKLGYDILYACREDESGKYLTDDTDIFSDGGFVLYYLSLYNATGDNRYIDLARDFGRHIAATATRYKDGGEYYEANDLSLVGLPKNSIFPGFAHGTAGIGFIFAALYEADGQKWELEAASNAALFLEKISVNKGEGRLIPYLWGGETGEDFKDRYYIGFCHGPAGSSLLFRKLHEITGDTHYLQVYKELAEGIVEAGAPEFNSWGMWNSYCTCCGTPGLVEYFTEIYDYTGDEKYLEYAKRSAARVVADSAETEKGRCFFGHWSRTNPKDIQNYTGLYIGAAGAGANLLRLYGNLEGKQVSDLWEYSYLK